MKAARAHELQVKAKEAIAKYEAKERHCVEIQIALRELRETEQRERKYRSAKENIQKSIELARLKSENARRIALETFHRAQELQCRAEAAALRFERYRELRINFESNKQQTNDGFQLEQPYLSMNVRQPRELTRTNHTTRKS